MTEYYISIFFPVIGLIIPDIYNKGVIGYKKVLF